MHLNIEGNHRIGEGLQDNSYKDKKFIKLIDKETIKDGKYYQMPLSFESADVCLLSNKVARKKAPGSYKKNVMLKNKSFQDHCMKFMKELFRGKSIRESIKAPGLASSSSLCLS